MTGKKHQDEKHKKEGHGGHGKSKPKGDTAMDGNKIHHSPKPIDGSSDKSKVKKQAHGKFSSASDNNVDMSKLSKKNQKLIKKLKAQVEYHEAHDDDVARDKVQSQIEAIMDGSNLSH
mmetsp:Transcript_3826/g.5528  ORF Transcript_3826/g.5528 Transcript_3826/m.5528 type:complete len:118 (+) Transcript_3826:248-601(+)